MMSEAAIQGWARARMGVPPSVEEAPDVHPRDRLRMAQQLVHEASKDPAVRRAALDALRGCPNVPQGGAAWLARWVRANVQYSEEAPRSELLQGPFETLVYQVGDCDDLVILWASLARSVGLDCWFAGVAADEEPDVLRHAVGWCEGQGYVELSRDRRWGGPWVQPLAFRLPAGYHAIVWSPEPGARWRLDRGDGRGLARVDELPSQAAEAKERAMRTRNPRAADPGVRYPFMSGVMGGALEGTKAGLAEGARLPAPNGGETERAGDDAWWSGYRDLFTTELPSIGGEFIRQRLLGEEPAGLVEPPPQSDIPTTPAPRESVGIPGPVIGLGVIAAAGAIIYLIMRR